MYPVSAVFRAVSVSCAQTAVVKASIYLDDVLLGDFGVTDGSVTCDGTSEGALRSLSLTVAPDPDAWGLVTTPGAEIRVWRGLSLSEGDELAALGVFTIDADPEEDADTGAISISAGDRSRRISRARWPDPYTTAAGTDVSTAVIAILRDRWPACPVGFGKVGKTISSATTLQDGASSDPWKDARDIATTAGYDLYFDADGMAQLRITPDPATADPCLTLYSGETGVVTDSKRVALLSQVYNGVIATGEGSSLDVPVRGECWDDDPTSQTYRYGPMGQVPYFYSSSFLTTTADATGTAQTTYTRIKGRAEQRSWSMVPNPALEYSDVVDIVAEDGTTSRYMLDTLTIPLLSGAMTVTARKTVVL